STILPAGSSYTLADMATDAVAVLDAVGVGAAHVFGVSMGGMIVQQLAIDYPDRMRSLTSVMSTTGDPDVGRPSPEALAHLMQPPPTDRAGFVAR
ncbi:MAG: alpha/beta hydrolase, partial [Acidimicrobiia bacterium]